MTNMHMGIKTVTPQAIMKINYCHFFKKNSSNQSAISAVNKIAAELISRKNIPVMNQPQRKHVIRD